SVCLIARGSLSVRQTEQAVTNLVYPPETVEKVRIVDPNVKEAAGTGGEIVAFASNDTDLEICPWGYKFNAYCQNALECACNYGLRGTGFHRRCGTKLAGNERRLWRQQQPRGCNQHGPAAGERVQLPGEQCHHGRRSSPREGQGPAHPSPCRKRENARFRLQRRTNRRLPDVYRRLLPR